MLLQGCCGSVSEQRPGVAGKAWAYPQGGSHVIPLEEAASPWFRYHRADEVFVGAGQGKMTKKGSDHVPGDAAPGYTVQEGEEAGKVERRVVVGGSHSQVTGGQGM